MKTIVRILKAGGAYRIVRAKDNRTLFGDKSFDDVVAAREYLTDANSRSVTSKWSEEPGSRGGDTRLTQLSLFA